MLGRERAVGRGASGSGSEYNDSTCCGHRIGEAKNGSEPQVLFLMQDKVN